MKENQASFTAMSVAYMRAYHSMHDTPKIFDDFLAYNLIPNEKIAPIEKYWIEQCWTWGQQLNDTEPTVLYSEQAITLKSLKQAAQEFAGIFSSRARYAEDALEKAVKQGVKQYVILGAGMDTFAFRQPEMMEKLEVFEVDHPATQEFKLHRLAELRWKHPAKLHFIPIDFTKESLVPALTSSSSYDPEVKSFFSCLGVINFLSREKAFAALCSITEVAPAGSIIVFDYLDIDAFVPEKMSPHIRELKEFLLKIDEPIISGFNPSALAEDLASLGFRLHDNLSPQDIKECCLLGYMDGYHVQEHGHFACAIVE
jgi:methyltransferase (TIGR00027 family)